jgi:hypothetical protein
VGIGEIEKRLFVAERNRRWSRTEPNGTACGTVWNAFDIDVSAWRTHSVMPIAKGFP